MEFISKEKDQALRKGKLQRGDVVLTTRGTIGNTGLSEEQAIDSIQTLHEVLKSEYGPDDG